MSEKPGMGTKKPIYREPAAPQVPDVPGFLTEEEVAQLQIGLLIEQKDALREVALSFKKNAEQLEKVAQALNLFGVQIVEGLKSIATKSGTVTVASVPSLTDIP